jgi:bifunctional non-homologous end joining protein LigD
VEMKFDGVRAVATITPAAVHLFSRNNADITAAYPEIASGLSEINPGRGVIVDGEIVAPAASSGRPRFDLLQQRTPNQDPPPALQRAVPVAFYIFDLLAHRGAPILRWPVFGPRPLTARVSSFANAGAASKTGAGAAGAPRVTRCPDLHRRSPSAPSDRAR